MNECSQLESYTARLLEEPARRRFEQHLETCAACAKSVAQVEDLDVRLASWLEAQPRPEVREAGARRLMRAAQEKRWARRTLAWSGAAAMAAAVVLVIALRWEQPAASRRSEPTAPPPVVAAVDVTVLFSDSGDLAPGSSSEPRVAFAPRVGRGLVPRVPESP
jgi:anti-sigma factor RsiW